MFAFIVHHGSAAVFSICCVVAHVDGRIAASSIDVR
jgi:hypothetical protein